MEGSALHTADIIQSSLQTADIIQSALYTADIIESALHTADIIQSTLHTADIIQSMKVTSSQTEDNNGLGGHGCAYVLIPSILYTRCVKNLSRAKRVISEIKDVPHAILNEREVNTLWTGDADLRLCITTVEDG